jgi:small subunit ribosomal protein S4
MQLREKQRARYTYGVLERQFRRYYAEAVRRPGVTGDNLVRLLESRLDNVVYRLGFADSRAQARQLVNHGHLAINGRKTGIPSALVKAGDIVGWTESGKKTEYFKIVQETVTNKEISPWVVLDKETMTGRVLRAPEIAEAGIKFDPLVIVEYYSR